MFDLLSKKLLARAKKKHWFMVFYRYGQLKLETAIVERHPLTIERKSKNDLTTRFVLIRWQPMSKEDMAAWLGL